MQWTADRLSAVATGYWASATLIAAVRLGVFEALSGPASDAVSLGERLGLQADRLAPLLDGLAAVGLLDKRDGDYAIPADLRPMLDRASDVCMLDALAYNGDLYQQWSNLAGVIRGETAAAGPLQLGGDPQRTRRFVLGMDAKARAYAPALADAIDMAGVTRLLDVGAGPGTLSRAFLGRDVRLSATLLDLPAVLDVAKEVCAASPVAGRLSYHPADYRRNALPGGHDGVLYAGALHQETPQSAAELFGGIHRAMPPGGRLFVVDLMLDDGRTSPPFSALFQLNMLLLRPGSRVFAVGELVQLLEVAGFADCQATEVPATPYRVVSATRA